MVETKYYKIAFVILVPILLISMGINIYNNFQPKYVTGIVDHKSIGTGTDNSGELTEWYTISLWLVTKDDVNGFEVGETIAYIVEENSYNEIVAGDVIKATLLKDLSIEVLDITRKTSKIVWTRSGGFIGLDENIVINNDGTASYSSIQFGDGEMVISKNEYEHLMGKLNYFTEDVQFLARQDAADYFIYRVTVQSALGTRVIEWVDSWASQESIPIELDEIELHFLNLFASTRKLISFEESVEFALKGSYSLAGKWDFSEYQWLGDYKGETFVTVDGLEVGFFEWRTRNGTLYEAEYPRGEIHGEIERFTGVDNSEEYYVWKIILMDGARVYIDSRSGDVLSFSPSRFPGLLTFDAASRIVHSPELQIEEWNVQNYTRVGDFESKPFETTDGLVKGHLLRRLSNGTLYEVLFPATQYPQSKVLHIEVPDDVEEYNIWEITTEENVFYIDARNGIIRLITQ
jgi:hypothetical protein